MADLDVAVRVLWTSGQRGDALPVLRGQRLLGPPRRLGRNAVEAVGSLNPRGDLVVVASDHHVWLQIENPVDDLVRVGTVADEIAQHEQAVVGVAGRPGQHRLEGVDVTVNVAEN